MSYRRSAPKKDPSGKSRTTKGKETDVEFIPMTLENLDLVMELERNCFTVPWGRELFEQEFALSYSHRRIAWLPGEKRAAGFIIVWIVADEMHVLNVAVGPEFRRRGVGRALMEWALEEGRNRGSRIVTLEVRRTNKPAQELYRSLGFRAIGLRPRYYQDNQEDAVVMIMRLDERES